MLLSARILGCSRTAASNTRTKIFVKHPAKPYLLSRCLAFPFSPDKVLGCILGKKGWSGGGRGKGKLSVILQLCKQAGSEEDWGGSAGAAVGPRSGLPSPEALQSPRNSGWKRGWCGDRRFGVIVPHHLPQAAPRDGGGMGGMDKWGCANGVLLWMFSSSPMGFFGIGMKWPAAGIAWIFLPAPVIPAGSSLGWSMRRQREKPAWRLSTPSACR